MNDVFYSDVVMPVLGKFSPISREEVGGPRKTLTQIARDNTFNALCHETCLSLALSMGAMFERQFRSWLNQNLPGVPAVHTVGLDQLLELLSTVRCVDLELEVSTLRELWLLSNVARHGDGPSARKFYDLNQTPWNHIHPELRHRYFESGLQARTMRVNQSDLARYHLGIACFWNKLAASRKPSAPLPRKCHG